MAALRQCHDWCYAATASGSSLTIACETAQMFGADGYWSTISRESPIGTARCRGRCIMRSHSCQQRLETSEIGANNSAALRHSIAAVSGKPFFLSCCAARQYPIASVEPVATASIRRNFHVGLAECCSNLPAVFMTSIILTSHPIPERPLCYKSLRRKLFPCPGR